MKALRYGLAIVILAAMASPSLAAQSSWDVCIDPATDVVSATGFVPGGFASAAANIFTQNSIPEGGILTCADVAARFHVVGTFYANVGFEFGLPAATDVEGFVTWQFDFGRKGTFATIGTVPFPVQGQNYIQTIVGSSGKFPGNGVLRVKTLDPTGFQFRIFLP